MAGDDGIIVVVGGVRVRRDEATALGIVIPDAVASPVPAPQTVEDDEDGDEPKRKSRTPANKGRRAANK